ncbi:MAG TPA: two-component system activity regulator YycH [Bacillales bacterium]|nr:two-component system activity regulator YycH [Bacillales bacterium]
MKYENFKSTILMFLVFVSILLTWNLWTYQPNYETMEKSNNVDEVTLGEKQEVKKIIKPDKVLFHFKGEHYGISNTNDLDKLMREMGQWVFYDVRNYPGSVPNINEIIHGNGNAEIVFPAEIPVELYRNVLKFSDKKLPTFNFDRIIINVENSDKDNGIVYFVSTTNQHVYVSHISPTFLNNFNRNYYRNASQYTRYFVFKPTEKRLIFLPSGIKEMMSYKYLPFTLNSEEFKKALFRDPSFVQKSFVPNGEEYTNGSSKMNVNYDTNMLLYVNPTAVTDYDESSMDLVKRGIDFVNEHGGWTDPYRYVGKDEYNHKVTFRLYSMEGYPVFGEKGISEINEVLGRNEINKYVRPSISLELPLKSETKKVSIPTANNALDYLEQQKNFKLEQLEDIILGYRMERDSKEPRLILLKPTWFYRYNNTWNMINMEDLEGVKHGLE